MVSGSEALMSSVATATPGSQLCLIVQVAPGDAMIIASDGLFDNLFDEEIAEIVNALVRVRKPSTVLQ
jgi:hypothetical protein